MKLKRKRKAFVENRDRPNLIGYVGKATVDRRLFPTLRMDRKYRNTLEQAKRDRNIQITQLAKVNEQYENLTDLLKSVKHENTDDFNSNLLMELDEMREAIRRQSHHLKVQLECFPRDVKGPVRKKSVSINCQKHQEFFPSTRTCLHSQPVVEAIHSNLMPCNANKSETPRKRSRWSGSGYKSQIFVRKSQSQIQPVNIDLFSSGEDLLQLLSEEYEEDINAYSVMFGTKQVDEKKTLFEQEVYHGTTVELNLRLQGGMHKRKKSSKKAKKPNELSPETWTTPQVAQWISDRCEEYGIAKNEVSKLKSQNGKALDRLSKEDWIRRSDHGDLFFDLWQEIKQNVSTGEITDKKETVYTGEQGALLQVSEEKSSVSESGEDFQDSTGDLYNPNDSRLIRKVVSFEDMEDSTPLGDFGTDGESSTPMFRSIISVRGRVEKRPRILENFGTLLIRDEPQGAASSYTVLKIDIRSSEELRPHHVNTFFKEVKTGTQISIKGRVEKLEEDDLEKTNAQSHQCEYLRFKVVVDSDQHSIDYVEKKAVEFKRQLSQPQWLQQLCSTLLHERSFGIGDSIEKAADTVFCHSADTDEIMKYVVAFKNSYRGNVLVGVKENNITNKGEIVGLNLTEGDIMAWREKLSMTIGNILPSPSESAAICSTKEEALELYEQKSFIVLIDLSECEKKMLWVHVPKGEARLYVTKSSDVHAYVRTGAETKRITDFAELFCRLDSLGSRNIIPISDDELDAKSQYDEVTGKNGGLQKKYQVLKDLKYENQEQEFKMIFGDNPRKTIQDKYLTQYSCGFLNSSGGSIIFGVQEDERSKIGHIVGILMSEEERKALVETAVETLGKFFPPVNTSQYRIVFHDVSVPSKFIVKYNDSGKCVLLRGPADEVGHKWPKFANDNLPDCLCRVVRIKPQLFCIVGESLKDVPYDVGEIVKQFVKQDKKHKMSLEAIPENELKHILKEEHCIIELTVKRSQYPIHMAKPINTYVIDQGGKLVPFDNQMMMHRFGLGLELEFHFGVKKFLNHVDHFIHSGNSYILIASPFKLSSTENDVYGLVIPKWVLAIDFDQNLKQEGHLYELFNEFNDLHQMERNRFIKTPQDSKLGLNPDRGICWLAARGYDEIEKSLSKPDHGSWNMTHREDLRSLLKTDLTGSIKPNYLNIVVLWDEGHEEIVDSLRVILEDILSIYGKRTAVTIVCCTDKARRNITENLVEPLQKIKSYREIIMKERVYVAPPHVLARHLSSKLLDPYKPENEFQVPHKREYRGKPQTFPRILPKHLRQNINGYLKMLYISKAKQHEKVMAKERMKFYSGSEITFLGLQNNFGIQRAAMEELENNFKILLNDRKSNVSMISIKVERGAGSTTMCLQFLFKHHEEYPCAQLVDIGDGLLSYIKDIYRETKLPLIIFVDEEIAHLQDFFDFTKELVEYRHINVILVFIEPKEAFSRKATSNTRMKTASDQFIYGTCPYKEVTLRRELGSKEMDELTAHLIDIKRDKEGRLQKLKDRAEHDNTLRTFVHFGLTAFGENFLRLHDYVKFRLKKANKEQRTVLSYLSLIHVFTNSLLPVNALANFLEKKKVNLEEEFSNPYLRELLSPPGDEKDSRRISFHEVAQEILKQLGSSELGTGDYWLFIKSVSVEIAKNVLSINGSPKAIDRLTRRLFVTSEYESEKFSSLIRAMTNEKRKHIARDTLTELVDVFTKHSSFSAHLLAHLAKYYMIEFGDFENARPRIEKAVKDQEDDTLLRHIHGDIIRLHVQALKSKSEIDMETIVEHAIKSSDCFAIVRRKRPHVSHGYISDAIVRITVMQAAIKDMGGEKNTSFIDYLIQMVENIKETSNYRLFVKERYLLSLIPDVHQFLNENVIDVDHKEKWKVYFRKCIGNPKNLQRLCVKIREEIELFEGDDSTLLRDVALQILVLNNSLEIETKSLNPLEIERLVKEVYDPNSSRSITEQQMKFWIRNSRLQKNVPRLEEVRKVVKNWVDHATKKGGISRDADFYNYVIHVIIAMKDPKDAQKREKAEKLTKKQQEKIKRRQKTKEDALPVEWLHPKEGHHINSIDSLLHHDDLVKETNKQGRPNKQVQQPGRDVIEGFLFEKGITKWEGTVKDIQKDWQGTIVFNRYFDVRFVPQNVQPSMPSTGDTVRFCLSFDRLGLMAWAVVRAPERNQHKSGLDAVSSEEESSTESDDENNGEGDVILDTTIFNSSPGEPPCKPTWEDYKGKRMQGVVVSTNPQRGFGKLEHPHVSGELFFHASQLAIPVKSLKGEIRKSMVLEFKVEKLEERTRAADIRVLAEEKILPALRNLQDNMRSSPSTTRREKEQDTSQKKTTDTKRWEEGAVVRLSSGQDFGFITPDNKSYGGKDVFFHRRSLVNKGQLPQIDDRVQFYVSETKKGYEANEIRVQNQSSSVQRWEQLTGIQEGFVDSVSDDGGYIMSISNKDLGYLSFQNRDVLNRSAKITDGTKVHFQVRKRGGRCIAVQINVIGSLQ